jgi:hypothetical protein
MDRSQFDFIRSKHGSYASWALWAAADSKPKSNIGDLTVLDPDLNPALLQTVRTDVVMVGLNFARPVAEPLQPFCNFHDPRPIANDFKLRYAFSGTPYWGAYMTDIIKNVELLTAAALRAHLRAFPALIRTNVVAFINELRDLSAMKPTILAFGRDTYGIIAAHVPAGAYSRVVPVMHYSHYISKEKYRDTVLGQVAASDVT